jgi:hypothetical protein
MGLMEVDLDLTKFSSHIKPKSKPRKWQIMTLISNEINEKPVIRVLLDYGETIPCSIRHGPNMENTNFQFIHLFYLVVKIQAKHS